MVNCVYPTFLHAENQSTEFFKRLVGIQANASSKDPDQLEGSEHLQQDPLTDWGENMLQLNKRYGVKILGGCCGTDHSYLQYLVEHL
jgi:methionine synthase I (cobalamin-dependent)